MIIKNFFIKFLMIESNCPKCGKDSCTDMGSYWRDDLPKSVGFWCENCGDWEEEMIDIGATK